jgi:flagellar FliL protein
MPADTVPAPKIGAAKNQAAEEPASAPARPAQGGLRQWLPMLVAALAMPALAYLTTAYVLVPKLQKATGAPVAAGDSDSGAKGGKPGEDADGKINAPFGKVLVNISGSLGMRYLLASLTLVGTDAEFKAKIDHNRDRLMDLALSTLGAKTIADLEKPGARNLIRTELISAFNTALGQGYVQEIYFTEFAVQ